MLPPSRSSRLDGLFNRGGIGLPVPRNPEADFWIPILVALEEMRGHAETHRVLDRVGEMLDSVLTTADRQRLKSKSAQIRWRNTACWARDQLIKAGLLASDSPYRIWELTQKGRNYLDSLVRAA